MIPKVDNLTSTVTTWAEYEVEAVLDRPMEDRPGERGVRNRARGKRTQAVYLRVVYVPDPIPNSVFVITAYELGPKTRQALRLRRKREFFQGLRA